MRSTENPAPLALADLCIRTKDRRVIPFRVNAIQRLYLDELLPGWERKPTGLQGRREILLKARQHGFSTLILALFFLDTITTPNTQTVVIAHDTTSTERLFQMVHRFERHLSPERRPRKKYSNRRELLWEDLDSYFFVGTAGSGEFGRGGTINNVHGSEVAFWPNAEELVPGLLEAVPTAGNVFLETTANGLGNWFRAEYLAAESGHSVYTPRFFAWHQHAEYRTDPVPADFRRVGEEGAKASLYGDEEGLAKVYGLTDSQLVWRRDKIRALKEKFPQEYPSCSAEAFLTSGNPYFDREQLHALLQTLQSAEYAPVAYDLPTGLRHLKAAGMSLQVWTPPQAGHRYIVSADTAEGLTGAGDHDYDSADVFDRESWQQVAQLHGRWDPHEYGLMCADLGTWYHAGLLGIERNNHGHAVIAAAWHTARYPNLYEHAETDAAGRETQKRFGWPTTPKSKYLALDGLAEALTNGDLKLRSPGTVQELLTYVKLPGGKAGGEGRSHDDRVTSAAIGVALLSAPPARTTGVPVNPISLLSGTTSRPQGQRANRAWR